jgi:hypothetical protein
MHVLRIDAAAEQGGDHLGRPAAVPDLEESS